MYDILKVSGLGFEMMSSLEMYVIYCMTLAAMIIFSLGVGRMSVFKPMIGLTSTGIPACCAGNSGILASSLSSPKDLSSMRSLPEQDPQKLSAYSVSITGFGKVCRTSHGSFNFCIGSEDFYFVIRFIELTETLWSPCIFSQFCLFNCFKQISPLVKSVKTLHSWSASLQRVSDIGFNWLEMMHDGLLGNPRWRKRQARRIFDDHIVSDRTDVEPNREIYMMKTASVLHLKNVDTMRLIYGDQKMRYSINDTNTCKLRDYSVVARNDARVNTRKNENCEDADIQDRSRQCDMRRKVQKAVFNDGVFSCDDPSLAYMLALCENAQYKRLGGR